MSLRVVAATLLVGWLASGCTGIGIRTFSNETYDPAPQAAEAARVLDASPERAWLAFIAVLESRGARFELREDAEARAVAQVRWSTPAQAAAAVDLGRVRVVLTETTRTYRSWSLLDIDCNSCVVRNGTVIDQQTELLEERIVELDPDRYRIEALVSGRVEPALSGTRLILDLDLIAEPNEPRGIRAESTGWLERHLLDAVAALLVRAPISGELR